MMKLHTHPPKHDELPPWQRFRLKNLDAYRRKKAEYARTPEQRAKRTEYMRVWREANRERHNELARKSHQKNKHKHIDRNREWWLRSRYGIGLSDKQAMIEKQGNKCGICGRAFWSTRSTHVDHDHISGKIRGILCHVCNTKLEWYETNHKAIDTYLNPTA